MGDWVPLNYLYPLVHRHWTEPEFTFAIENLGFVEFGQKALGFALDDPRVAGLLVSERRRPTPVSELAEVLDHEGTRMPVLRAMLQASCVDDDLHDEEVVLIRRVAEALGIPSDVAVHMIDWSRDWLVAWRH